MSDRTPAIAPFIYPWPSRAHRSVAEVAETERLQKLPRAELNKLPGMVVRLDNLLRKAAAFNPPAEPDKAGVA